LSSADWTTFNSKQGTITLTTTGTSGAATFSSNTLNIPQYQGVLANPVTGTGTTNYLPKWTSGSALGNSIFQDDGTNAGILISPNSNARVSILANVDAGALSLIGRSSDNVSSQYFYANNYTTLYSYISASSTSFDIRAYANIPLTFYQNNTEGMRLTSTGLGIGTTSPSYKLDVSGNGRFLTTSAGSLTTKIRNEVTSASGGTGYGLAIESEASAATSYALTVRNLAESTTYFHVSTETGKVGNVGIGTTSPVGKLDIQVDTANVVSFRDADSWSGYAGAAGIISTNANSSGLQPLEFYASAYNFKDGNVGIGNTSPSTILELGLATLSNPTNNQFLRVNAGKYNEASTSNLDLFNWGNNFAQPLGWRISSATDSVGISVGRHLSFNTVVTDGSGNVSTATERLRVTSGGNVSIGNTNDTYKLDVTGSARFNGSGANGYLYVFGNAGAGGSTNPAYLQGMNFSWNKSNGSGESLITYTGAGGGSNIRFGIGYWNNSTYSEQFTIASTGAATFSSTASATAFIPTGSSVPTIGMYSSAANTLDFATNTTNKLSISSTGTATFSGDVYATGFIGALETSNNIRFNQTLSTSSSGASGNYLTINCNGVLYKLELLTT
jgi:hypothetical protein